MIRFTIDGRSVTAAPGMTILEAAQAEGIDIPTLCYLKEINEIGSCRICMVEIEGHDSLFASCRTKAEEGMTVRTSSEKIDSYRRTMLRLSELLRQRDLPPAGALQSIRGLKGGLCGLPRQDREDTGPAGG